MGRRGGAVLNALGMMCVTVALLIGGASHKRGTYFSATVKEPFSPFDPQHQGAWLIAALILVLAGTALLSRRD